MAAPLILAKPPRIFTLNMITVQKYKLQSPVVINPLASPSQPCSVPVLPIKLILICILLPNWYKTMKAAILLSSILT
jgi:hypothetical protein